jgi:putative ABC transport system permease protein
VFRKANRRRESPTTNIGAQGSCEARNTNHEVFMLHDLRYTVRILLRNPVFTLTAVLALALGIGASTAVFSVVDRILFRSLPYTQENRLVSLGLVAPIEPQEFMLGADYVEWRRQQTPLESLTSWSGTSDCDLTDGTPVRAVCAQVEANFLRALGVRPLLGRDFAVEDDRPGAPRVVLLSYGLWQRRFAGDQNIAGRTLFLDGFPTMVVGVLPREFELPTLSRADLLVPQMLDEAAQQRPRTGRVLRAFARLKPGLSLDQAQLAMQPLYQESLKWVPPQFQKEVKFRMRLLRDRQTHDARLTSWVLLGSVASVLLIACVNVANLLLARAVSRRRELAIRATLGAGWTRLVRQTLTESVVLALLGGALGCFLAQYLLQWFVAIAPEGIPRLSDARLDWRVLLFALGTSLLSALMFGLAPALAQPATHDLVRTTGRLGGRAGLRQSLVVAQIAISLVLLTSAGLMLRSLWKLLNVPLGMQTANVLTVNLVLGQQRYSKPGQQQAFFEQLEARIQGLPGVETLAISDSLPPAGMARTTIYSLIDVEGRPPAPEGTGGMVVWRAVTPGYFAALGVPILRGRSFNEGDLNPSENTVILSSGLASRLFQGEEALERRIRPGRSGNWLTVVGIAANVLNAGLNAPSDPEYYIPRKHLAASTPADQALPGISRRASLILRSALDPESVAGWVRKEVAALDATLPVTLETMPQRVGQLAARSRFNAWLLSLFSILALCLSALGLYGVMAFLVEQRTSEIGVRMALGATPNEIAKLVLFEAGRWTFVGLAFGLLGSQFTARWLNSLLFHISARDPLSIGVTLLVLVVVAVAAAWIPARRAAAVDPMVALRSE